MMDVLHLYLLNKLLYFFGETDIIKTCFGLTGIRTFFYPTL
jgi:hypothetical protein